MKRGNPEIRNIGRHRSAGIHHYSWRMCLLKVSIARYLTDNEVLFPIKKKHDREVHFKYTETVYMAQRSKSRIIGLISCSLNVCLGFLNTEKVEEMLCHFTIKIKRWVLTGLRLWLDLCKTKSNLAIPLWPCPTVLRTASSVRLPQINPWVQVFFPPLPGALHFLCRDHLP